MRLDKIIDGMDFEVDNNDKKIEEIDILGISYDSRKAAKDNIFVAIVGETLDGHKYIPQAYENGARIFVVSKDVDDFEDALFIKVENTRLALSKMSHNFYGRPSEKMKIVGVTGTKGKTTISNFLAHVLNQGGINTGVIGTNGTFYNNKSESTINTTPESYELHKIFKQMYDEGVECVCMEVSSSGMMMNRVEDVDFDVVIFNNISMDHIGPKEHPTFQHYLDCKARLFTLSDYGLVNRDDGYSSYVEKIATCEVEDFGIYNKADFYATKIRYQREIDALGVEFDFERKGVDEGRVFVPSPGNFSIYNALAVIATCEKLGLDFKKIKEGISTVKVDGRVEVLDIIPDASIIIDYAHNGVSLENVLNTLLEYHPKRLICLYGSIGGRAALRRQELGEVAARLTDVSIITTDNPDDEDPEKIIDEIAECYKDSKAQVIKIVDREEAIRYAIRMLEPGDMLVLAGKGHEKYQYIHGKREFFDEKAIAIEEAKLRNEAKNK